MVGDVDFVVNLVETYLDRYNYRGLQNISPIPFLTFPHSQDCFTHSNFFQVPFLLPPSLPFLSLCLPLLNCGISPFAPLVMRKSFCNLLTAAECLRGGEPRYIASSGVRSERSPTRRGLKGGRVVVRDRGGKAFVIFVVGGGAWLGTIMCWLSSYEVNFGSFGMFGRSQPSRRCFACFHPLACRS